MTLIFLPGYCFKTKYQEDLDQMRAENGGEDPIELDFTTEDIKGLRELEKQFEKRRKARRVEQEQQQVHRRHYAEEASKLEDFWNDPDPDRRKID